MAWARATIEIRPAAIGTGIKVHLRRTKTSPARIAITINDRHGRDWGWVDGDKVEVLVGQAEHHGLIRLRKNNSTGQAVVNYREMGKGSWYVLNLGHQAAFVDRSEAPAWCQWEKVEDGWIEIVLPKWADETSPAKSKASAPAAAPAIKGARTPVADVTATVMGDPPPGRRQMIENFDAISRTK